MATLMGYIGLGLLHNEHIIGPMGYQANGLGLGVRYDPLNMRIQSP